ncbi:MAG: sensor histidine kinase N-terminal domain-containing protein [Nitrospirae bacterium]|nr:sensor histidine kinase N-terminal domain-containing protein [Nitrospirota bacterium]MBF0591998.1 sensor histidine kinase N-terminal domain-containing protein [Nitrospirota bacterium]
MVIKKSSSLLGRLLLLVLPPILLLCLLSGAGTYYLALKYANIAFDRTLADSARDLTLQITFDNGVASLNLAPAAFKMFLTDEYDKIYFKVSRQGNLLAGEPAIPSPDVAGESTGKPGNSAIMHSGIIKGKRIRVATLYFLASGNLSGQPVLVQVAETLNKRKILAREIATALALPQFLMISLTVLIVLLGIGRGLSPLQRLCQEIAIRSHRDLSPVELSGTPDEVHPLIHAINELMQRLGGALEAQQRFIADAAHQLKTPLSGLKTQTDLALRQTDPQALRRALGQISASTDRIVHLVKQMLALAEVEPGTNKKPNMKPLNLDQLTKDTTIEWVPHALRKKIDLGYEGPDRTIIIEGDSFSLKMLIDNLLDNAICYSPTGSRITTKVETTDGSITLSVEDNGPGIPGQERTAVFQRFYRILGNYAEGSGLGLSIVAEIAAAHKATVELDEPTGHTGTIVKVKFPLVQ